TAAGTCSVALSATNAGGAGTATLVLTISASTNSHFHFVRAGATGNGSGSDWTNAYRDLPAGLVRGDTYYVAAGNYGSHTFNDSVSGTSVITIQRATVADHGTEVGWSSSYDGQAAWNDAQWTFNRSFYT